MHLKHPIEFLAGFLLDRHGPLWSRNRIAIGVKLRLLSAFVTVLGSVDPVDVKRCVVEWKAYTLSDSGLAHLQIICMTSSEQPAAFRAVARPLRSECQEWQDATCSPYRRTRAECSRVSITLCVYGKPYSSANSGVSSPWSSRL